MAVDDEVDPSAEEEQPPFGSWSHWYLAVLLALVVLIVLFYGFTRAFG